MPLLYPHAPKRQVIPPIPLHPASRGNKQGLWVLRVTDVTTSRSGPGSENVNKGDELAVFPMTNDGKSSRPLQIGDKGTFKAHIQGTVGRRPVWTVKPATVTVKELSNYVLNARVRGIVCDAPLRATDRKRGCINGRPVDMTIVKGLAGWHMPNQKYVVEDTASTKQYRAFVKKILDGYMNAQSSSGPSAPSSNATASGGKTFEVKGPYSSKVHKVGKCDCTCNDTYHLDKLHKEMKSGKRKQSSKLLRHVMAMSRCMRPCSAYYRTCKQYKR
jgi:hypothetical protein